MTDLHEKLFKKKKKTRKRRHNNEIKKASTINSLHKKKQRHDETYTYSIKQKIIQVKKKFRKMREGKI